MYFKCRQRVVCSIAVIATFISYSLWRASPFTIGKVIFLQHDSRSSQENVTSPLTPAITANLHTLQSAVKPLSHADIVVEFFPSWTTADPHDVVPVKRVYVYSATLALQQLPPNGSHIRVTAFQEKRVPPLTCCLKRSGKDASTSPAPIVHFLADPNHDNDQRQVFGVVYQCHVPLAAQEVTGASVTLTPAPTCPPGDEHYLPVHIPEVVQGGLAICAKVAFGSLLDPLKLVEWFEMQKLLGVDKIQILDFGNPSNVTRVFEYYQNTGLLSVFPYKLPGRPWGRGFTDDARVLYQLNQDEDFPLLECRLRLAGYDYVMGIDMDEIILPRTAGSLKPFFQGIFGPRSQLAAAYFHVQFFIEEFGAEDKEAPLHVLRFLKSTPARWECQKYAYMPARTNQCTTHGVSPYGGFSTTRVSPTEAVIHHYRRCPHVWPNCNPPTITDRAIVRFRDSLVPRVKNVLSQLGL